MKKACWILLLGTAIVSPLRVEAQTKPRVKTKTKNVVVITADGMRWQELFRGGKEAYMSREDGGATDPVRLKKDFLRANPEESRRALLPFFWNTIAKRGQIYGNKDTNNVARVANPLRFSYPGYNEILSGRFDPQIDSNDFGPNPNVTVLEWLNRSPEFRGKVSVFGAWYKFADIFNRERSGLFLRSQWEQPVPDGVDLTAREKRLRDLYANTIRVWDNQVYDSFLHAAVMDHVQRAKPRVLFIGYGETDLWAHANRYDQVLRSAHSVDKFIGELWTAMQEMPQYRDSTTFIITTDHGRGTGPKEWKNHGEKVDGSDYTWIAIIGPDTPALGERRGGEPVNQAQIAATVAALLGKDYNAAMPDTAPPLADAIAFPKK